MNLNVSTVKEATWPRVVPVKQEKTVGAIEEVQASSELGGEELNNS